MRPVSIRNAHRDLRDAAREVGLAAVQVFCAYVGVLWAALRVQHEPSSPGPATWGVWCAPPDGLRFKGDWLRVCVDGSGAICRMSESQARAKAESLATVARLMTGSGGSYEARRLPAVRAVEP